MGLGKHVGWGKGGDFEVIKWGGRGGASHKGMEQFLQGI